MNIVGRIGGIGSRGSAAGDCGLRDRAAFKHAFGWLKTHRSVADANSADADITKFLLHRVECYRRRRQGKIAAPAGELPEAVTALPWPGRETDLGDNLIGQKGVTSAPRKKSGAAIERGPALPRATISASQVTAMPGSSAAGSACARLPPTVPRLRI